MALKKKFVEIEVPMIGETVEVLGTVENLKGRNIKLDMSRRLRGRGLEISFKILSFGNKLVAFPRKMQLMKSFIRRVMRLNADYVEDSFKAECKDIKVIIKPFLITRKRVSRAIRKNLRNTCREFLIEHLKERNYADVCYGIYSSELQRVLLPKLKKVYPLSFCDIRVFEGKELEKIDLANSMAEFEKKKDNKIEENYEQEIFEEEPREKVSKEKDSEEESDKKE